MSGPRAAGRRRRHGGISHPVSALTLQLRRYNVLEPAASLCCLVSYLGDDAYEVRANGEFLRFLSREAAAAYLSVVLGDAAFFDYSLLRTHDWATHYTARQATADAWVLRRLLLLLRDARR